MLTVTENPRLPKAYRADTALCFKKTSEIVKCLFAAFPEQTDIRALNTAFVLEQETVEKALALCPTCGKIVIGEEVTIINAGGKGEVKLEAPSVLSVQDYLEAAEAYRKRVLLSFAEKGVVFQTFDGVVIHPDAVIGEGTLILAGTQIGQDVVIGEHCEIGPRSHLISSTVKDNTILIDTRVVEAVIGENVKIGPYCNIRPNSTICDGVKIGDFVEVKNSVIGRDTHASHLTYIGDSDVGERVNFGCGVVTANYDGYSKFRTTVGDDAFIGCNTNLVAPVTVGKGAYTACGSTITDGVPENSLGLARARQVNKDGWADSFRAKKKAEGKIK